MTEITCSHKSSAVELSLSRLVRFLDRFWFVVAVGIGLVAALFPAVAALPTALMLVAFVGGVFGVVIFGVAGSLALIPPIAAMALLKRFDEMLSISVGRFTIPPTYWLGMFSFLGLLIVVLTQHYFGKNPPRPAAESHFLRRFWLLWTAFVLSGILSSVHNAFFDVYVTDRSFLGEMLALGMIVVPMGFVGLIPAVRMSEHQTLRVFWTLIAFLTATAFLMAFFALAPGFIVSALGITQRLDASRGIVRGWTPLGHSNSIAALFCCVLATVFVMSFREKKFIIAAFYFICFCVLLVGTVFSQSRSGLASALLVVLISLFFVVATERRLRVGVFLGLVAVSTGLVIGAVLLFSTFDLSRYWSRGFYEDASIERRWESMTTAARVFWDHPVLGVSPNAVYTREDIDPYTMPEGIDLISTVTYYRGHATALHPHNLPLTVMAEFGVVGSIIFLGVGLLCAVTLLRGLLWFHGRQENVPRDYIFSFLVGLTGFVAASLGGALFLYSVRIGMVFWSLLAIMVRYVFVQYQRMDTH